MQGILEAHWTQRRQRRWPQAMVEITQLFRKSDPSVRHRSENAPLSAELLRLAETAPHLLNDVGADVLNGPPEHPIALRAGRG